MSKGENKKFIRSIGKLFKSSLKGANTASVSFEDEVILSPAKTTLAKLRRSKLAALGAFGFLFMFLLCFVGSMLMPLNENHFELTHANLRPGINYLKYPKELADKDIDKISSGVSFSAALTTDGDMYIWGTEPNKQQENVSEHIFDIPQALNGQIISDIACGANHMLALTEGGELFAWGYGGNGQTEVPTAVTEALKNGEHIIQMEALSEYSAVLLSGGEFIVWGSTQAESNYRLPSSFEGRVLKFSLSDNNVALLLDDNSVAVLGDRGTEFSMLIPENIADGSTEVIDIVSTNRSVLALDSDGELYVWGAAQDKLLTIPDIQGNISEIGSGYSNFYALTDTGDFYFWGNDHYNQLTVPDSSNDYSRIFADYYQFYAISSDGEIDSWGNDGYIFGTDEYGRDMFLRLIHGGRISLTVGAIAVFISCTIALIVGLCAGYFGGIVDSILMRVTDIFSAIPFYPIAITVSYAVGFSMEESQKIYLIMIILGLLGWMSLARLIRAQLLSEREKDFVTAAKALGLRSSTVMVRHLMPNILNLVIVNLSLSYASSLLSEAALSFLGFGVADPTPSWGNMLTSAQELAVIEFYWWRWLIPALFVVTTAVSINFLGDALREALDPRNSE